VKDKDCIGDYYQWGRGDDGHEKIGSTTTTSVANEILVARGNRFITTSTKDWLKAGVDDDGGTRISIWEKTDGNSICPNGFRIPTQAQFDAEITKVSKGRSFRDFLKLEDSGYRENNSGSIHDTSGVSILWTSSVDGFSSKSISLNKNASIAYSASSRATGIPVRCIREE
jgi:uncharacterized protein (TIGR02145 family)